jgi:hypothetical protein
VHTNSSVTEYFSAMREVDGKKVYDAIDKISIFSINLIEGRSNIVAKWISSN